MKKLHTDPLSNEEIHDLFSMTLHGSLPSLTQSRVFATLAAFQLELATKRREVEGLTLRLAQADKVIDGYGQDEPPIVKGALDAQAEAETQLFAMRRELDALKAELAAAKCSWCAEFVCPQHAAPGQHPGCGPVE